MIIPLKILFSIAGKLVWIQSSTLIPRSETSAEELCWFGLKMSCYIKCFFREEWYFNSQLKRREFPFQAE